MNQYDDAEFTQIIVGPFWVNVLDLIGRELHTRSRGHVVVRRAGMDFVIYLNGEEYDRTASNVHASNILNSLEVGNVRL